MLNNVNLQPIGISRDKPTKFPIFRSSSTVVINMESNEQKSEQLSAVGIKWIDKYIHKELLSREDNRNETKDANLAEKMGQDQ